MASFRKAVKNDLDQIENIVKIVVPMLNAEGNFQWNDTYPLRSDFEADIKQDTLWVAIYNDLVIGVAAITTDQPEEYSDIGMNIKEPSIVPHRIAANPNYKGLRIAENFILIAEKIAKEKGLNCVRIDTNIKNDRMQHVIKKLQFEYKGTISFRNNNKLAIYDNVKVSLL